MQISQLNPELVRITDIPIVVPFLPERTGSGRRVHVRQTFCKTELQVVHRIRQSRTRRFIDQQVNVFRHDHISIDADAEMPSHFFETCDEQVIEIGRLEARLSAGTTEGEEVGLSGLLKASQTSRHSDSLDPGRL